MNPILVRAAGALLCIGAPLELNAAARQAEAADPSHDSKLRGNLAEVAATVEEGQLLPVTIVLARQAPSEFLDEARTLPDKALRRLHVTETLKSIANDEQRDLLAMLASERAAGRADDVRSLWIANVVAARVHPSTLHALAARDDVAYVNYDEPRGEEVFSAMPAPGGTLECGVDLMDADRVWDEYGIEGKGAVVGIIDTGLCITHSDIENQVWTHPCEIPGNGVDDDNNGFVDDVYGWDFGDGDNDVSDTFGHGSHVSGTVAGDGTGGRQSGMAPDAQVMTLKVDGPMLGEMIVWEAIQYGVANGADVLSGSLGWHHSLNPDRATWRMVCEGAMAAGVVTVFAAHNFGCGNPPDDVTTPGDVPDVITVGATDCNDAKANFSSCGPTTWQNVAPYNDHPYPPGLIKPTVSAPGVGTWSHNQCNGYTTASGTSMSTPHISGAVALLLQADPTLDHFAVKQILENAAVDLGQPGKDNQTGWGRVDAYAAVTAALAAGNFCQPKVNSCGSTPSILSSGFPSSQTTSGFEVSATNANVNKLGVLLYTDSGAQYPRIPFQGGLLCIDPSGLRRGPPVNSNGAANCDGVFALDMNAFASGNAGGNPAGFLSLPGTEVHCQWWGRDTVGNSYLSDALSYTVCE